MISSTIKTVKRMLSSNDILNNQNRFRIIPRLESPAGVGDVLTDDGLVSTPGTEPVPNRQTA